MAVLVAHRHGASPFCARPRAWAAKAPRAEVAKAAGVGASRSLAARAKRRNTRQRPLGTRFFGLGLIRAHAGCRLCPGGPPGLRTTPCLHSESAPTRVPSLPPWHPMSARRRHAASRCTRRQGTRAGGGLHQLRLPARRRISSGLGGRPVSFATGVPMRGSPAAQPAPPQRSSGLRATSPFFVQMASETLRPVTLIEPPTKQLKSCPVLVRTL